jgi:hypothetical protein
MNTFAAATVDSSGLVTAALLRAYRKEKVKMTLLTYIVAILAGLAVIPLMMLLVAAIWLFSASGGLVLILSLIAQIRHGHESTGTLLGLSCVAISVLIYSVVGSRFFRAMTTDR